MPRKPRIPKYSLHKPSGRARVILDGKHIWLGKYGSDESMERYNRLVAELVASPATKALRSTEPSTTSITITELCAAYWRHAQDWYVKDGKPTKQLPHVKQQLRILRDLYGSVPVDQFGPLALQAIQAHLVARGLSRVGVNARVGGIKRAFKWGVSQELVPPSVYHALACVAGLRKGRTVAPECDPIGPVDDGVVDATIPHLPRLVADMVMIQRLTGMRPSEVCILRPGDLDRSSEVWSYQPGHHKTEHHGRNRVVYVGPQAQDILRPYLLRAADAYCFQPAESEKRRLEERHEQRKTPLSYGNSPGTNKERHPKRPKGDHYTRDSYRRAVHRAVKAINRERAKAAKEAGEEPELLPLWSPNRLRHSAATKIRKAYGLEAAQVILGHAKADITQVYAERDSELARSVATQIG